MGWAILDFSKEHKNQSCTNNINVRGFYSMSILGFGKLDADTIHGAL